MILKRLILSIKFFKFFYAFFVYFITTTTAGQTNTQTTVCTFFLLIIFIPYYLRLSVYFNALSENIRQEFNT